MKKLCGLLIAIIAIFTITACQKEEPEETNEPEKEKLYYEVLPMPSTKIDKTTKDVKDAERAEYILYVKDYSYKKFYDYIMSLEKIGFHYEFVSETVPESVDKLNDKTETSWAADNGKIWIRAQWRSKDNIYFNGYSLQLIFDNYDYMKPLEPKKEENNKEENNKVENNKEEKTE